jgi:transcriptional regulator with XRE-family HTH domain
MAERHWVFVRRLRARRRELGLTQAEVAALAGRRGVALTNRALSAMENGRGVELGRLPDLAAALDCTITYLLGLSDDPARWAPDRPDPARAADPPTADPPTAGAPVGDRIAAGLGSPAGAAAPPDARRNWILGPDPPQWTGPRTDVDHVPSP